MARYLGPKIKLSRRVGVPIADIPKHTARRQLSPPGMHGYRGRRLREYGVRLIEKQKLRFHYHLLEKQFRRYMEVAQRRKGNTGEVLLELLESRLDNTVRRAGFARTIWQARQFVVHGHVLLNGRKTDRPSCAVHPGDEITIKERLHPVVRDMMESMAGHITPEWMDVNPAELKIRVVTTPHADDIPFDVNMNLVIEFYR